MQIVATFYACTVVLVSGLVLIALGIRIRRYERDLIDNANERARQRGERA